MPTARRWAGAVWERAERWAGREACQVVREARRARMVEVEMVGLLLVAVEAEEEEEEYECWCSVERMRREMVQRLEAAAR